MRDHPTSAILYQCLLQRAAAHKEERLTLLRSLKKNQNQSPAKLAYTALLELAPKAKYSRARQVNYCTKTGRARGYLRLFGLSRHALKSRALIGGAQNIKSKSW